MAFSMFLRTPACANRMFMQQVMRYATQQPCGAIATQRAVTNLLSIQNNMLKTPASTPILNAVRSFRTSAVRMSEEKPHDHAKLWVVEKVTSAILVPLIPIALIMPNKLFDTLLAIMVTAHSFWGLEAIAVDYVRASIFGPIIPKIAIALVYLLSIATLGGLMYIITHDIGIANAIRRFWSIGSEQKA